MKLDLLVRICLASALVGSSCGSKMERVTEARSESDPRAGGTSAIELVAVHALAGDARDHSGLSDRLEDGSPRDRLGGFGSAIAWTGLGSLYVTAVDRGPEDGATTFPCRLDWFDIVLEREPAPRLRVELVQTTMLVNEFGAQFVGSYADFDDANPSRGIRLDPEGIRVGPRGTLFVSDEYGPWIVEFSRDGKALRRLAVPERFHVARLADKKEERLPDNLRGRVSNRGFEGLAIAPDGDRLFALLQGPLIQDGGRDGVNCRLLEVEIATGRTREFVVALDRTDLYFNELLALDATRFLAIERDSKAGAAARVKSIVLLETADASDISAIARLDPHGFPPGVVAVRKVPFLDLLDPRFLQTGASFPEKIEGLCLGPDLPDGRHLLLITSDNDLRADAASWIWAFSIARAALPGLVAQRFESDR